MKLDGLIAKYREMLEELDPDLADVWGNNRDHVQKSMIEATPEIVANFAAFEMGGLGFEFGNDYPNRPVDPEEPPRPISANRAFDAEYGKQVGAILPKALEGLFEFPFAEPLQIIELVRWDGIAGGRSVQANLGMDPVRVSHHTLRVAWRAYEMRARHGAWPRSLLEIGGGHGRFVRDVAVCSPETKLFYCDLPLNLLIAASYLSRKFPGQVSLLWTEADVIKPEARITLIAPWRLGDLPDGVEICCNFLSFQHMSAANLAYYSRILEDREVGALFHMNRDKALHPGEVDLDQAPFNTSFELISELALGGFGRASRGGTDDDVQIKVNTRLQYLRRRGESGRVAGDGS